MQEKQKIQQNNLIINLGRRAKVSWLTIASSLIVLLFYIPTGIVFPWQTVFYSLIAMVGLNLFFSCFVKRGKLLKLAVWLWPVGEVCLITLIVYYTGGFSSIFSFLYLIPITTLAILFSLNAGMGIAIFSSVAYLGLTLLEVYEFIPHISKIGAQVLEWQDNVYIAFSVLLNRILIFFGVAFLSGVLSVKQKKAEEMKDEFISITSHQLRTPITSIRLFTEMLRNEKIGSLSDKYGEYLDNIYYSAKRVTQLVDDFLNVSRLETGKLEVRLQLVQFENLIQNVINEVSPLAGIRKCCLVFQRPETKLSKILIDSDLIRQVLHNLLTNAIRYSPERECDILVKLEQKNNEEYLISVRDSGIGIPEKAKPSIFEKFFRADNAKKIETEGAGLGLYIAKMIMKVLNGKIWFESEENKGSTFYVSLPMTGEEK